MLQEFQSTNSVQKAMSLLDDQQQPAGIIVSIGSKL